MWHGRAAGHRSRAARRRRRSRISRGGALLFLLALAAGGVLRAPPAQAASVTWTGLGSTNNWSEGANWSTGSAPGSSDIAIFNATSTKDATINGAVSVSGVQIAAGYTGTITQAAVSTTVGASGFSQAAGSFVGSSSAITVNGGFTLNGGSFTSTAGTLSVSGAFGHAAGAFLHNSGTVAFTGGATTIAVPTAETFNHLRFAPTSGGAAKTVSSGTTLVVEGALTLTEGSIATGTVAARGAISQASTFDGGTGRIVIDGAADQTFTGAATNSAGTLPNVEIAKPSGTLALAGTIRTNHNWTHTSGGLDAGTSTVVFAATATIAGSQALANVTFNGGGSTYTVAAGTALTVNGALTLTDGSIVGAGSVAARGAVSQASTFDGGTGLMIVEGAADQTFTGTATTTAGSLPNVELAKPSGTLSLIGTIRTNRNWTYMSGALDPGAATVVFAGTLTVTGSHGLANVVFNGGGSTSTVAAGTTLTVDGALALTDGSVAGTGSVAARGAISQASTFDGGTGFLVIDGTADQIFTGAATTSAGTLPNLELTKASGTLALVGTIRTNHNWTYTSGDLDPGVATVVFAGTLTVTGSHSLNNVAFNGGGSTYTVAAGTTVTVNGGLTLTDGLIAGTGSVAARGAISQASTFDGGTGLLVVDGAADQIFTGAATTSAGTLPNLELAKPSGTLSLVGTIRTNRNWTYTSGGLDAGTSTLVFAGTLIVTGSHTLSSVEVRGAVTVPADTLLTAAALTMPSGFALTVNGSVIVNGALTLTDGSIAGTGSVAARGAVSQASTFDGGTGLIVVDGTADQIFTGAATTSAGTLPNLELAKASGTLAFVGTIRTNHHWTFTSGDLDPGVATVVFAGTLTVTGSHSLNNVTFNGGGSTYTVAAGTTVTVNGGLTLTDGSVAGTGSVAARGAISQASTFDGGTGLIVVDGTADQTFTGTATTTAGSLPNVELAKPSGTLSLVGTIRTTRNWTYTSGGLDPSTSMVVFAGTLAVTGSHSLNDVAFNGGGSTYTVASGTTVTVNGGLTLTDGSVAGTGSVAARGAVSQASTFDGGTGLIVVDGTADQAFTGSATTTAGLLPNLELVKPSGTLTLVGTIRTNHLWTYTSGGLDPGASTVLFAGTLTVTGSHTLNNVTFNGGGSTYTVASGTTLTVNGGLTLTDGSINTGTVAVRGAISQASTFDGGTGLVIVDGTADQAFTGAATTTAGSLPNVELAKPSGTLMLAGTIRTTRNWTYTSGGLDSGAATVVFAGTLNVTGSHALANVTFNGGGSYTVASGTSVTVDGALTLTDGSINTGTVVARGNLSQASTFDGGTGLVIVDGAADQTLTGTATTSAGALPNVDVAKPSGTLTLVGTIRTARNWTYTSGALDPGTSTVVFAGTLNVTGSHALANVTFNGGGSTYTVASGTTLTVDGALTLTDGAINSGTVAARGNLSQASTFDGGTGGLLVNGSIDQAFTASATSSAGNLTALTVNKPSGILTLAGTIRTTRNWTHSSGAVDSGTSTVIFAGTELVSSAGMAFANLTVDGGQLASGVTLVQGPLTVTNTLTLASGTVTTGSGKVVVAAPGTVVRTSGHVNGNLQRAVPTGSAVSVAFAIGDASSYTPVDVSFGTVTAAGSVTAGTVRDDHPGVADSGVSATRGVDRWWKITNAGTLFDTYGVVFNFVAADLDTAADPSRFVVAKRDGATWTRPSITAVSPTSIEATGMTSFSDFVVGEPAADVAIAVVGPSTPGFIGGALVAALTVSNAGPSPASNVTVTYPIPAGLAIRSVDPDQGSCTKSNAVVSCDLGGLEAGATTTITIGLIATAEGTDTHTATVIATDIDPEVTNNTVSWTTSVVINTRGMVGGTPAGGEVPGATLEPAGNGRATESSASSSEASGSRRRDASGQSGGSSPSESRDGAVARRIRDLIWPAGAGRAVLPGTVSTTDLGLGSLLALGVTLGVIAHLTHRARRRDIVAASSWLRSPSRH